MPTRSSAPDWMMVLSVLTLLQAEVIGRVWSSPLTIPANARAVFAPLLDDLVPDAPDEDARMVAVAQDHVFEVAPVPLVPVEVIVELGLLLLPHVEGFVHHD